MKRDGIAFLGVMGATALLAGQGALLASGFTSLFVGYYALKLTIRTISNLPAVKEREEEFATKGYELSTLSIPSELDLLKQFLFSTTFVKGDKFADTVSRFLSTIGVDCSNCLSDYLYDGIVLKIMWEYRKKHGTLYYDAVSNQSVSEQEANAMIDSTELNEFHRFCVHHSQ